MDAVKVSLSWTDIATIGGAIAITQVLLLILKSYLADYRWLGLVLLGMSAVTCTIAQFIVTGGFGWMQVANGVLNGLLATCVATYGYETQKNVAGLFKGSH